MIKNLFKINWRYRTYNLWVINTTSECLLYLWENWYTLLPHLNGLIELTNEEAFIRTFQGYKHENKWLGFGRMKWNKENNRKWTTKYRGIDSTQKELSFYYTEVWAPDWNQVCDTGIPPDVFVRLYNYPQVLDIREGLIIALPLWLYKKNKQVVDNLLSKIASQISESKIYETKRDWWGRTASRNNVEDINPQEIKKIVGCKEL